MHRQKHNISRKTILETAEKLFESTQTTASASLTLRTKLDASFLFLLHFLQTLTNQIFDSLLDAFPSFCASLEVAYAELLGQVFAQFSCDYPVVVHILFVAHEYLWAVLVWLLLDFWHPEFINPFMKSILLSKLVLSVRSNTTMTPSAFLK